MKDNLPSPSEPSTLPDGFDPSTLYAGATDEVHLRDYLKILLKRRRTIVLVFLLSILVCAYVTLTATKLYTAKTTLKIEPQNPTVTGVGELLSNVNVGAHDDYYETQFKLLESRTLAAKVIKELGLDKNKSFLEASMTSSNVVSRLQGWLMGNLGRFISWVTPESPPPEPAGDPVGVNSKTSSSIRTLNTGLDVKPSLINRYTRLLKVAPIKRTRLVDVQFSTPDPVLSQALANAHAQSFIRLSFENRFELTREAREFLDAKRAELRVKLERAEHTLNNFRQEHGVVSMDKGENIVVDRLVDLNRQLTIARSQRIEAESLHKTVANQSVQHLSQVITQGLVPTLRNNLQALEAEKVKLSVIFKPEHPRLIELNQQIAETRRALSKEIANVTRGIEEAFIASRAKEQALQAETDKQQRQALAFKELGVQYAVLEEDVKVNRALYEGVLKRLNETHVSNDIAISNMQIAQWAEMPLFPSSPNIPFNFVLAMFIGLFLGVGLAFALEYFDSSVGTPQQAWQALTLNTFGVVPDFNAAGIDGIDANTPRRALLERTRQRRLPAGRGHSSSNELIVSRHPLSVVAESYRAIRTSLLYESEKRPQIILLTSPTPGEGKTITTLNLAIAFAQDGYNVLVIDADLRKGCCHLRMGLKNHLGLSNVIRGQVSFEQAVQPTSIDRLSVLTRGFCPPNPSELLGSEPMRKLLRQLRDQFNFILVDSPPAIAVSDTAVLSTICDGVLLVLHSKISSTASAQHALQRLGSVRAPVLGTILNSIDLSNPDYSYYRNYYEYRADYVEDVGETNGHGNSNSPTLHEPASLRSVDGETVPHEFVERMVSELTEAVGPMASLIVRDQIEALGESRDRFPKSRLSELVSKICQEILDDKLRQRFQNTMAQSLRAL